MNPPIGKKKKTVWRTSSNSRRGDAYNITAAAAAAAAATIYSLAKRRMGRGKPGITHHIAPSPVTIGVMKSMDNHYILYMACVHESKPPPLLTPYASPPAHLPHPRNVPSCTRPTKKNTHTHTPGSWSVNTTALVRGS